MSDHKTAVTRCEYCGCQVSARQPTCSQCGGRLHERTASYGTKAPPEIKPDKATMGTFRK